MSELMNIVQSYRIVLQRITSHTYHIIFENKKQVFVDFWQLSKTSTIE